MEKYKGKTDEDGKKNLIEQAKEAKKLEIMISKTCNKIKQERDISKQMNHFEEIINSVDGLCDEYNLHNFEFYNMMKENLGERKYNSLMGYLDNYKERKKGEKKT